MKVLFTTFGQPGSGKSYVSIRLAKDLNLYHLNSDQVRHELFSNPKYTFYENKIVFAVMDKITDALLSNEIGVIYDGNLTKVKYRQRTYDIAEKYNIPYYLLWFKTSLETSIARIQKRGKEDSTEHKLIFRPIDESIVHHIHSEMELPTNEPVIILDGQKTYEEQLSIIKKALTLNLVNKTK